MSKPLVIVESPAKAKTISQFLGDEFIVEASVGHIRDLPSKGLSIDVDSDFRTEYEINPEKKDVIKRLRALLKDADELYLATDEDREGEAIAWHLKEVLKPKVPVRRMVFHEITRSAIEHAVENSRDIDYNRVDAQETRRIVDRLYGYPVSQIMWRKVNRGLSAGRVQSPAVRLVVERERERIAFVEASYWDLTAAFATSPDFTAKLVAVDGARVATGRDFANDGQVTRRDVAIVDEARANDLRTRLDGQTFAVQSVEQKPWRSRPKPPFMTSTLQQEGGRKLRMSANQVMRIAQGLYEKGYITYMRTDSVTLSETALAAARSQVTDLYGADYLPDAPRTYTGKSKNAQEAHEAIRPAGETFRTPNDVKAELRKDELALYDLIWKRTVASQMADATGHTVSVRIAAEAADTGAGTTACTFGASGRVITFQGHLRAYVESTDDAEAADDDADADERVLPDLGEGEVLPDPDLSADGHTTNPPARYTEASLVKRMEELGIGRPSTYASIMTTIQDRGYVFKKGSALVPTWTAFAVVNVLERQFGEYVDYEFTAKMEDDLDRIAMGEEERVPWLHRFWFGDDDNGREGLAITVDEALAKVDAAEVNTFPLGMDDNGEIIVAKPGRYGPYVKRGEGDDSDTASIPDGLPPDELTLEKALELLAAPKGDVPIGDDPDTGLPVYVKSGRFGPYVQLGDAETLPPDTKPKMESLFKDSKPEDVTLEDALRLLSLPREVGVDEAGETIYARNGRYGPYISRGLDKGADARSLESEDQIFTVTLERAKELFAEPKRRRGQAGPKPPLRELGKDLVTEQPVVVKDGRFGPYVTDGETNASLRKGDLVEEITIERASELLQIRRETAPAKKKATRTKKASAKKKATKKAAGKPKKSD